MLDLFLGDVTLSRKFSSMFVVQDFILKCIWLILLELHVEYTFNM